MATIDAVMSTERANAIIEKYKARAAGEGVDAKVPDWLGELRDDIANGINAAVAEAVGSAPALDVIDNEDEPEPVKRTRNTTHMPATGRHGK